MLSLQKEQYAVSKEYVFYKEMARKLTYIRKANLWIGNGSCVAQQQTLRMLDRALRDSFPTSKIQRGFPKFRRFDRSGDKFSVDASALRISRLSSGEVTHIGFPCLPLIRVRGITLPPDAKMISATAHYGGDGLSISLRFYSAPNVTASAIRDSCGIDMGCGDNLAIVASTNDNHVIKIENPRPLRNALKRLRKSCRKASRRIEGSVGRKRAQKEVARRHNKITNIRRHNHHKVTSSLVAMYKHISIETLNVSGMIRSSISLSIADAGMAMFLNQIRYKAAWYQRTIYEHGKWDRSTGCCPDCELIGPKLPLGQREWTCTGCGKSHDRDIAAAQWLDMVGQKMPEPRAEMLSKRGFAKENKDGTSLPEGLGPPTNSHSSLLTLRKA